MFVALSRGQFCFIFPAITSTPPPSPFLLWVYDPINLSNTSLSSPYSPLSLFLQYASSRSSNSRCVAWCHCRGCCCLSLHFHPLMYGGGKVYILGIKSRRRGWYVHRRREKRKRPKAHNNVNEGKRERMMHLFLILPFSSFVPSPFSPSFFSRSFAELNVW